MKKLMLVVSFPGAKVSSIFLFSKSREDTKMKVEL